jgi:hypothetical protein
VAQIAMIKEQLVTEERWISGAKFVKLHGIYQRLPGGLGGVMAPFVLCVCRAVRHCHRGGGGHGMLIGLGGAVVLHGTRGFAPRMPCPA